MNVLARLLGISSRGQLHLVLPDSLDARQPR
jgi:hypothetical protein